MCMSCLGIDEETYQRNLANTFAMLSETKKITPAKVGYYEDEGDTRTHIFPDEPKKKTIADLLAEGKAKFKDLPNWPV